MPSVFSDSTSYECELAVFGQKFLNESLDDGPRTEIKRPKSQKDPRFQKDQQFKRLTIQKINDSKITADGLEDKKAPKGVLGFLAEKGRG